MYRFVVLVVMLTLTACGGGGGSAGSPPAPVVDHSHDADGVWNVNTTAANGDPIVGAAVIVGSESFGFSTNQTTGCKTLSYTNNVTTDQNDQVSASGMSVLNQAPQFGVVCAFPDGSTSGTFSDTGVVVTQSTLQFSSESVTTSNGTVYSGAGPVAQFNSVYNQGSSLANLMGSYAFETATGAPLSLDGMGNLAYGPDSTGCTGQGAVTIINTAHAVYNASVTFSNCGALSGLTFTGFTVLDDTVSPAMLYILLQSNNILLATAFVKLS